VLEVVAVQVNLLLQAPQALLVVLEYLVVVVVEHLQLRLRQTQQQPEPVELV